MPESSPPPDLSTLTVGVLGGTGAQGRGLAQRWARAGIRVLIGSRSAQRGRDAAQEYRDATGVEHIEGTDNADAAARSDVVLAAIPWESHADTLRPLAEPLRDTILVDCVNPLGFDSQGAYPLPVPEGSAAQQAQALLPDTRVTAAFHHVSAVLLGDLDQAEVACDVLVLGDDRAATDVVRALADTVPGMRGVYGGRLRQAYQVECLTGNLIAVNRRYKTHAGLRITGLD